MGAAADLIGLSRARLYQYVSEGRLKPKKREVMGRPQQILTLEEVKRLAQSRQDLRRAQDAFKKSLNSKRKPLSS